MDWWGRRRSGRIHGNVPELLVERESPPVPGAIDDERVEMAVLRPDDKPVLVRHPRHLVPGERRESSHRRAEVRGTRRGGRGGQVVVRHHVHGPGARSQEQCEDRIRGRAEATEVREDGVHGDIVIGNERGGPCEVPVVRLKRKQPTPLRNVDPVCSNVERLQVSRRPERDRMLHARVDALKRRSRGHIHGPELLHRDRVGLRGEPIDRVPQPHIRSGEGYEDERDHDREPDDTDPARPEQGPVLEEELLPAVVRVSELTRGRHLTTSRAGPARRTGRPRPCSRGS